MLAADGLPIGPTAFPHERHAFPHIGEMPVSETQGSWLLGKR